MDEAQAGSVVAVTGLSRTAAGEGLGAEAEALPPALEPVLTYQVLLPQGQDPHAAWASSCLLEEEDPQLHLVWNEQAGRSIQLMGEVQLEILQALAAPALRPGDHLRPRRHRLPGDHRRPGGGAWATTSPLRHYAEVHLLLEPLPGGAAWAGAAACPPGHAGRELAGWCSPIWRRSPTWGCSPAPHHRCAHHPGGGAGPPPPPREATSGRPPTGRCAGASWEAESILLEPWYDFRLEPPPEQVGRLYPTSSAWAGRPARRRPPGRWSVLTGSRPGGRPAGLWPGGGRSPVAGDG